MSSVALPPPAGQAARSRGWAWLVLALTVAGAAALVQWGGRLPAWLHMGLWGALPLTALALLRRGWLRLLGPVFFYDLVRSARRGRIMLLRCLYLGVLLVVLFLLYLDVLGRGDFFRLFVTTYIQRNLIAQFAQWFFELFMSVQFLTAVLLAPAIAAGAIAEEKERKTLEFLLATDLGGQEIALGKLASRLAYVGMVVLTGLPVLSLLQFLGGVDPELVVAGFVATAVTVFSLGGLSLLNSVYSRKPRTAIFLTYLQAIVYFVASSVVGFNLSLTSGFCWGNIWVAIERLTQAQMAATGPMFTPWRAMLIGGGPPPTPAIGVNALLPWLLLEYASFHLLLGLVCATWAALAVRRVGKRELSARGQRAFRLATSQRRLPRVWDDCLLWKELLAEPMFRFNRLGMTIVATIIVNLYLLGGTVLLLTFTVGVTLNELESHMNMAVRVLGTSVACLLLLGVAIRAAGCISSERERQTFDSLLTAPVSNGDILSSKWVGAILSGWKVWWYLAAIWLVGIVTGGLHLAGFLLLVLSCLAYAVFLAGLGMWCSLQCHTTLRASVWTLAVILALSIIPGLLTILLSPVVVGSRPWEGDWIDSVNTAVMPPVALWGLALSPQELVERSPLAHILDGGGQFSRGRFGDDYAWPQVTAAVIGAIGYAAAGMLLWAMTARYFPVVTRRMPLPRSRRPPTSSAR